jgi:hypothetical protein
VPWVGGDLQQGFGRGTEETNCWFCSQWHDQLRQGEDHTEVLDRKQLGGTLFEPSRSGLAVTLRTMAIAARAVRDLAVAAEGTRVN